MKSGAILVLSLFFIISVLLLNVHADTTKFLEQNERAPVGNGNTKVQRNPRPQGSPQGQRTNTQTSRPGPQGQNANLPALGPRPKVQGNPGAQAGNPNGQERRPRPQSQGVLVRSNGSPSRGGKPTGQPQGGIGKCPGKGTSDDYSCSPYTRGRVCTTQSKCDQLHNESTCCPGKCNSICVQTRFLKLN